MKNTMFEMVKKEAEFDKEFREAEAFFYVIVRCAIYKDKEGWINYFGECINIEEGGEKKTYKQISVAVSELEAKTFEQLFEYIENNNFDKLKEFIKKCIITNVKTETGMRCYLTPLELGGLYSSEREEVVDDVFSDIIHNYKVLWNTCNKIIKEKISNINQKKAGYYL